MNAPATTAAIPAFKLRQGDKVLVYGDVPVTITDVELLPAGKPAQRVQLTFRCDSFAGGLVAAMNVPAGQTFVVYDDGLPF